MTLSQTTAMGYDRAGGFLTTVHCDAGGTLQQVIFTGNDQTTILMGNDDLPTEICNSVGMVEFSYDGDNGVTMSQTVNGQNNRQDVTLDGSELADFRNEYYKFNQNRDKRTYTYEQYNDESPNIEWELPETYVDVTIIGDKNWRSSDDPDWNLNIRLPLQRHEH